MDSGRDEAGNLGRGGRKFPLADRMSDHVLDTLSWLRDHWLLVFVVPACYFLYVVIETARHVITDTHHDPTKQLAVIALCVATLSACAGIGNFILSRFRIVRVTEIVTTVSASLGGESYREFSVDVRSYGAPVHDISVEIEVYVPRCPETMANGTAGTNTLPLAPLGKKVNNPLQAGQGQRFGIKNMDELPFPHFGQQHFILCLTEAMKRGKKVSLSVYSSDQRKRLRRVGAARLLWQLDTYTDNKLNARSPWWIKLRGRMEARKFKRRHGNA